MTSVLFRIAGLLIVGAYCSGLLAEENMQFKGTLIEPPPCTINQGNVIDISFGEQVAIARVDGTNYQQSVNYQLHCDASAGQAGVVMTLRGTATAFDTAAVQTNKTALGIRLLLGNRPFTLNTPFGVDPAHPPELYAVPVAEPGATLSEGHFDATATLLAEYQ